MQPRERPTWSDDDVRHMRRALQLARRGEGFVEPNPMVGCVLVRDSAVLGEGWHRRFGGRHAEVEALARCRTPPRSATAYVTLEPCCHHGKQPPCTDALIAAGVGRVVAAIRDPGPHVAGRGFEQLRQAGIEVRTGLLESDALQLTAPYRKRVTTGRPWVIAKWAQSIDGRLATRSGDSKWITGDDARRDAHRTRARVDAIIVGLKTVLADDPALTAREARIRRPAARIVLDAELRTPLRAALVQTAAELPTWLCCRDDVGDRRAKPFRTRGCRIVPLPRRGPQLDLAALLDACGEAGMANVLVEGGGVTLGAFWDAQLIDEVHAYIAPLVIGGGRPALDGAGPERLAAALRLAQPRLRRLGSDWRLTGRLH